MELAAHTFSDGRDFGFDFGNFRLVGSSEIAKQTVTLSKWIGILGYRRIQPGRRSRFLIASMQRLEAGCSHEHSENALP